MIFNSMNYLLFFPVVVCIYFVLPIKIRWMWLLVSSYYFYMCWNIEYAFLILFSTIVTYLSGILMGQIGILIREKQKRQKLRKICVFGSFFLNLAILFFFKYYNFATENIKYVLDLTGVQINIPVFDILLPVGISFYTFQALSYTMDVYRGDVKSEKNLLKYALYVSFFPQLVAGPIERSKDLLGQINRPTYIEVDNVREGLLTIAWGLFVKIVVADNIAIVINPILENYLDYNGTVLAIVLMLFGVQIYCDFDGYSKIAKGSAQVLGFKLNDNFDAPYMADSIKDFWRRWHISLTSWFRDYLYIPLGGNRHGKLRKYLNNICVFLCSGLWHGAGWNYIVWGGVNGLYIVIQDITEIQRERLYDFLKIDKTKFFWKIFSRIVVFLLIDFTWLFFRTENVFEAFGLLNKILKEFRFTFIFSDAFYSVFGTAKTYCILLGSILIVFVKDCLHYNKINLKNVIFQQQLFFRWSIYIIILLLIIFLGAYGMDYEQTQFIYFQF